MIPTLSSRSWTWPDLYLFEFPLPLSYCTVQKKPVAGPPKEKKSKVRCALARCIQFISCAFHGPYKARDHEHNSLRYLYNRHEDSAFMIPPHCFCDRTRKKGAGGRGSV
jgi:hypothetical protein